MPDAPEPDDAPHDEESRLLIGIWADLDGAMELSITPDAVANLTEIAERCRAVLRAIEDWQARPTLAGR